MHTCRIILFTSLVWFLLDVAVLFYYSDPTPASGSEAAAAGVPHVDSLVEHAAKHGDNVHDDKKKMQLHVPDESDVV